MKKFLALLLCVVMLMSLMASCTQKEDKSELSLSYLYNERMRTMR